MSAMEFFSQPLWQRLGLTLLHFVWQGLAVAVLVLALVHLFRLKHGTSRYAAYLLAFAVFIACPITTFWVIDTSVPVHGDIQLESAGGLSEDESFPLGPTYTEISAVSTSAPSAIPAPLATADSMPISKGIADYLYASLPWGIALWLLGVSVLSVRLLLGFVGMQRWRRSRVALPDELNQRIARLGEKLGFRRALHVFGSPLALEAMAVGYLRPMVLLPMTMLTGMPPHVLEAIIAHELAHIRRLDLWVNLLQRIVETLLFYHPAVWWLSGRLRSERELCCDAIAVRATGQRLAYASALEDLGRARVASRRSMLAAGLGHQRKPLLARVRHILGMAPSRQRSSPWFAGILTVAVLLGLGACGLLRPVHAESKGQALAVELNTSFPQAVEKERAATSPPEKLVFCQYDVRDLLVDMELTADIPPMELMEEIVKATGAKQWDSAAIVDDGKISGVDGVALPAMKRNSAASTNRLVMVRNGYLMVRNVQEIQEKVEAALKDIRAESMAKLNGQLMVTLQVLEADDALKRRLLPHEVTAPSDGPASERTPIKMYSLPKDETVKDKLLGEAVLFAKVGETAEGRVGVSVRTPGTPEERTLRYLTYRIKRNRISSDGNYASLGLEISDSGTQTEERSAQKILAGEVKLPVNSGMFVLGDLEKAESDVLVLAKAMILHVAEVAPRERPKISPQTDGTVTVAEEELPARADAELDALLAAYSKTLNAYKSVILKSTGESKGEYFYSKPGVGVPTKTIPSEMEFRTDGDRVSFRGYTWGNIGSGQVFVEKRNANYKSHLWDGKDFYQYDASPLDRKYTKGRVFLTQGEDHNKQIDRPRSVPGVYPLSKLLGRTVGGARLDQKIRLAEIATVRDETDSVNGSECYVVECTSDGDQYTIWLDPQHDCHVARMKVVYKATGEFPPERKEYTVLSFQKANDRWFPHTVETRSEEHYSEKDWYRGVSRYEITSVTVNPDHEKLKSFLPDDIQDGAVVFLNPWDQLLYRWEGGEFNR